VAAALQGRVGGVAMVALCGGLVLGKAIGGLVAGRRGRTAPCWFAFIGAATTLALVWRQPGTIAQAQAASA
jgi:hypothetical protein